MKTKPKRRNISEWRTIVSKWESSEQSQEVYCRVEGLSLSSFQNWRRKLKTKTPQERFLEVASGSTENSETGSERELILPYGIVLRVKR